MFFRKKHKKKGKRTSASSYLGSTVVVSKKKKKGVMGMSLTEVMALCDTIPLQNNVEVIEF